VRHRDDRGGDRGVVGSCGISRTNDRSIFTEVSGKRFSRASEE